MVFMPRKMPVIFSSYRLGPGQRASYKTVPPPWDWLPWRENELGPWRSKSRIIYTVLVPPPLVSVKRLALIVTAYSHCRVSISFQIELFECHFRSKHPFRIKTGDNRIVVLFSDFKKSACEQARRVLVLLNFEFFLSLTY